MNPRGSSIQRRVKASARQSPQPSPPKGPGKGRESRCQAKDQNLERPGEHTILEAELESPRPPRADCLPVLPCRGVRLLSCSGNLLKLNRTIPPSTGSCSHLPWSLCSPQMKAGLCVSTKADYQGPISETREMIQLQLRLRIGNEREETRGRGEEAEQE